MNHPLPDQPESGPEAQVPSAAADEGGDPRASSGPAPGNPGNPGNPGSPGSPGDAGGAGAAPDLPAGEGAGLGEEEWTETAVLPLEEVGELFVTLSKALRAFQLYDENNPVYRRFVANLREAFRSVWSEGVDALRLKVEEDRLLWDGTEVYRGENRNESLAFLLYKDGIRNVTFVPGIEEEELEPFLGVLQRARRQGKEGDDLLIILWEEDLEHFKYQYIDLLAEGVEVPESGDGGSGDLQEVLQAELAEVGVEEGEEEGGEPGEEAAAPSGVIDPEDFNPTLYSLDSRELATLEEELEKEMARDLREEVLNALFDRVEEPENRERQSEILEIFRTLLPNFLSRGHVAAAGRVLAELETMRENGPFDEKRAATVDRLLDDLSEPSALHELVQAIQDGSIRASPQELGGFLRHLRTDALAPLLRAVEGMEVKELQPVLREAVRGIGERHPDALPGLLESDDPVVVVGAARLAGRLGLSDVGPVLARLLRHDSEKVRLAAVEAALDLKASTAIGGIQDLLTDESRQVRIAAARALGQLRYKPAAARFRTVVTGKNVRQADLTEKIAFFESYGQVGDPKAVEILDGLLNGKGFLGGKKESPEIRACAALALGMVGSPEAEAALEKARGEEDPVVRNAVSRALRGEGGEE